MNEMSPVDTTNCDREPIHIPGAILPHGAMVVVDCDARTVLQAAGDFEGLFGSTLDAVLADGLPALFEGPNLDRVHALCATPDLIKPRHLLAPYFQSRFDVPLDGSVHRVDGLLVLEFERAEPVDLNAADPLTSVQGMLDRIQGAATLEELCQRAAERVRDLAGYDRVMIYRFAEDDTGWVIAEAKVDGLSPFLDLHYPASDIPAQARALYLRAPLRLITRVNYDPARLVPAINPLTDRPLDMSQATLRDVSPIHRQYLRNMGVDASMSISLVVGGRLWGLIACHHQTPRNLPRHLRAICELFGAMFSLQIEARERSEQFDARGASRIILSEVMRKLASEENYAEGLVRNSPNLLDYIDAGGLSLRVGEQRNGGVAVRVNEGITSRGKTPSTDQIIALTEWLTKHMEETDEGIFHTDRLSDLWPGAADFADVASGLLAVSVSRDPFDLIMWFRPEQVATVNWAGDPHKPVEITPSGPQLSPRTSFGVWKEIVRARSTPWRPSELDAAFDLRVALLEIVLRRINTAAQEREKAHARQTLLMAELDHRVKNTLANIAALVSQSSRNADSLNDFAHGLNQRIQSMSKAHSLLTQSRWEGVSLVSLIRDELEHYAGGDIVVDFGGPEVILTPKAALALSLGIHELATNAAKYGALSSTRGSVSCRWHADSEGGIELRWCERDGPIVREPARRGFGTKLIERALALETGGQSALRFAPNGVECDVTLTAGSIVRFGGQDEALDRPTSGETVTSPVTELGAKRILVVEDSSLVIMGLEPILEDLNLQLVGPATRLDEALELAEAGGFDAALLDVNLDGEMSWPVAHALLERGVPFAFTTGYNRETVMPPEFADVVVLGKPFRTQDVERTLRNLTIPSAEA